MQYEEINTDLNTHGFQVCMFFPGLIHELQKEISRYKLVLNKKWDIIH